MFKTSFTMGAMLVVVFHIFGTVVFSQGVRINEFMALNNTVLADEDGEYSDWIELYNYGTAAVSLEGWALSDDIDIPFQWLFSDVSIGPGEYLVVFASGKNRGASTGELHTSFKLGGTGEYLGLVNADGEVVSAFSPSYPAQEADFSYGYYGDAYITFSQATPGEDNAASGGTVIPAPKFSVMHGLFESPFQLEISSDITSSIYYTTDGSLPGTSGSLYSLPITVSTTTVIRALSVVNGVAGKVTTQSYIFPGDVIHQDNSPEGYPDNWGPYTALSGNAIADYEMDQELMADETFANTVKQALSDIPTISLVSDKDHFFKVEEDPETGGIYIYTGAPLGTTTYGPGRGWERSVSFEYFNKDSISFQADCGIRLQGGHSRRPEKSPKHSFLLVFKGEYGPSKMRYSLFDGEASASYDKLILRSGFGNSWIHHSHDERNRAQYQRDIWTKDTQREMGHPSSHSSYVHLYINGIYWGMYAPSERMDREFGAKYMGGDEDDYDVVKDYAEAADGNLEAWNKMMDMANAGLADNAAYQQFIGNNPDGSPNSEIEAMADVVNLADYMLINFYGSNTDWDHHNWAAMRNREKPGTGFKFMCWDSEHMLKSVSGNVLSENNADCPSRVFQKLMDNQDYKRLFADRVQLHCFNNGVLTASAGLERWQKRQAQISTAVYAESARWGDYRRDVHPYQTQGPFAVYAVSSHLLPQQDFMQNDYFPSRTDVFISQLRSADMYPNVDAPAFYINHDAVFTERIAAGDQLSMTADEGTIYFTTNGEDPVIWPASVEAKTIDLLKEDADKRFLVPSSDIGTAWRTDVGFNDSGWQLCSGSPGGIGYENNSGYQAYISLDVKDELYNNSENPNTTCYIRIPFNVDESDYANLQSLSLHMRYDDGFVAYLNGTEIARANFNGSAEWNAQAPGNHEANNVETFNVTTHMSALVSGQNILAVHGMNQSTTSSDFIMMASLSGSDLVVEPTLSDSAMLYQEDITLNNSAHYIARTYHNGEWSAASNSFFVIPADYSDLKITEVNYNPADAETISGGKLEFIEIKNTGSSRLAMKDLTFVDGIDYTFGAETEVGPGGFVVLASDDTAFYQHYGFEPFDQYQGKLDNGGEKLVLLSGTEDTICAFTYNDKAGWPLLADGLGHSMVPTDINPVGMQGEASEWRASYHYYGSPGADDLADYPDAIEVAQADAGLTRGQNFPNPFRETTYIDYKLPEAGHVTIKVYNIFGQHISTLVDGHQAKGLYQAKWTVESGLKGGVYLYRIVLETGYEEIQQTRKMLLMD